MDETPSRSPASPAQPPPTPPPPPPRDLGPPPPSEVIPGVWTGTELHAASLRVLRAHGIAGLLNVGTPYSRLHWCDTEAHSLGLVTEEVELDAGLSPDVLGRCFDFLNQARARRCAVLVYDRNGRSRSPAVAIAYAMWSAGATLRQAMEHVRWRSAVPVRLDDAALSALVSIELKATGGTSSYRHLVAPWKAAQEARAEAEAAKRAARGIPDKASLMAMLMQGLSPAEVEAAKLGKPPPKAAAEVQPGRQGGGGGSGGSGIGVAVPSTGGATAAASPLSRAEGDPDGRIAMATAIAPGPTDVSPWPQDLPVLPLTLVGVAPLSELIVWEYEADLIAFLDTVLQRGKWPLFDRLRCRALLPNLRLALMRHVETSGALVAEPLARAPQCQASREAFLAWMDTCCDGCPNALPTFASDFAQCFFMSLSNVVSKDYIQRAMAMHLHSHCHHHTSNPNATEADLVTPVKRVMRVVSFMQEVDAFAAQYAMDLALRLLPNDGSMVPPHALDTECIVLRIMKQAPAPTQAQARGLRTVAHRLQTMVDNVRRDRCHEYGSREWQDEHGAHLGVRLLRSDAWPRPWMLRGTDAGMGPQHGHTLHSSPMLWAGLERGSGARGASVCALPEPLRSAAAGVQAAYLAHHPNRRLAVVPWAGCVEMTYVPPGAPSNRRRRLVLRTDYAIVLLQWQHADRLTATDVHLLTALTEQQVGLILTRLTTCEPALLCCRGDDDGYELNVDFAPSKRRFVVESHDLNTVE